MKKQTLAQRRRVTNANRVRSENRDQLRELEDKIEILEKENNYLRQLFGDMEFAIARISKVAAKRTRKPR